jgi:hypothetical protein
MDFSAIKRALERVVAMGQRTSREVYLKFNDDKERSTPLIAPFGISPPPCSNTRALTPLSSVMDPIPDPDDWQLQDRCRALRTILGPSVPDLIIQQLIQNYNSIEAALNGYLDNEQNYQTSNSSA